MTTSAVRIGSATSKTSRAIPAAARVRPKTLPGTVRTPSMRPAPRPDSSPIVKWAGGKGRLLAQLTPLLPAGVESMRHVEPFVGGAAFFFARRPERALLCDVNPALVGLYEAVRDEVDQVIEALSSLAYAHAAGSQYYAVRTRYNDRERGSRAERAAMFIYLNKTCFNGLHRVNRRGEFNVPEGRYVNPKILDEANLRAASQVLKSATLHRGGFEDGLELVRPGDFVYLDPPYEPVSTTANFTAYAEDAFTRADQTRLRDVFAELDRRGAKLMLSNSDVPFIRELYGKWRIDTVAAPRAISCNAEGRAKVTEVVVRNY